VSAVLRGLAIVRDRAPERSAGRASPGGELSSLRGGREAEMGDQVIVPHASLTAEALRGVIEDFITREGTDYGMHEASLEQKHEQVARQIEAGEVVIVFDVETESVNLMRREQLSAR
jgi:uncharacterized protein YheU (UPF0270 family)